jgi:hypothetical protein
MHFFSHNIAFTARLCVFVVGMVFLFAGRASAVPEKQIPDNT